MPELQFSNPIFAAYAASAATMVLLGVVTAWATVIQMMRHKGGFRAPEDLRRTPLNPQPRPDQTAPLEAVDRYRRIMQNHLENLPFFLVIGLLFVLTGPSVALARWLFAGYVVSRLLHFLSYASAQVHDIRATFWTIGSLILVAMSVRVLAAGVAAL
ncbi:MAPEG family protein [Sphingomicrobium astaxanthinifaciens]|uniref:MAPEG family protein n=1 Tax=Sphingomicrobium astaxanthinifaciens TaxID=1227949 RepID=UPI001FCB9A16|nr:MAPEG family protein [Sphingomicrobium astaxanthinifaciens]MCJ7421064.1 MAPEG family protein [Sphingomicrobium astaxanthinifaciens]